MRTNTDWFRDAKWGVFTHYLVNAGLSAKDWNAQVESFDTGSLAAQLEQIGTKYYFITIGQNSGHYCTPNAAYDSFVGIEPSKCSRRDLVSDLHEALSPKGITLMVYLPSGAPDKDPAAMEKLQWKTGPQPDYARPDHGLDERGKPWGAVNDPNIEFQQKWEAIIKEWSQRWGNKVAGWWFDGCYFADAMYRNSKPPNFQSFAAAAKAGNPSSIVAFNPGVKTPVISLTEYEDYTAGEVSLALPVCPGRWVDGAQYHILSYLGDIWGKGDPRLPDEFVIAYTKQVNAKEGVVTWDVPIDKDGTIPQPFARQLEALAKGLRRRKR